MKIEKLQCLRGPNYWSAYRTHLIQIKLNLEQSDQLTTAFSDFEQRLENLMPSLRDHRCMHRQPGGFFKSLREGTNLAHVIEHVALELQSLAGMPCGFGRTYKTRQKGVYTVIFSYKVQSAGAFAAEAAIRVVEDLVKGLEPDIKKEINALEEINRTCGIGPSTQSILNAARRRKIPFRRLDDNSLVLLGQGVHQKIIQATTAATTSNIGVEIAADKDETKKILAENFIPTPAGKIVKNAAELQEALHFLGFPIVLKPLYGNHGRGITTSIFNFEEALKAFEIAQQISEEVIAERFIKGADFRFLVINFKVEAVARRTAAFVIGDGISTVHELIERTNENPNRGEGHEKILTKIKQDEQIDLKIQQKGLSYDSVLPAGEILFLKDTANLSSGGTARDATEIAHPYNIFLAERVARLMNLDICGIDVIAEDITNPISEENGAVLEVNAAPGFRMHLSPEKGIPRDVGEPVIRMLYPEGAPSRIPIVAVTGTNGKTTTTRLIAHFARNAGYTTGFCTTDGIYINHQQVCAGDCSGPSSAETILRDPIVDFAVLECARGGILVRDLDLTSAISALLPI